ncbi:hypothetical protein [Devosia salina]|uniref:DNA primase/polymerase bifunctional N-terminal domain-containing protein n=2 Tax=Pseudomonadota TaxID=1224 RepID=A0ABX8WHX8_9HYPH|nr:hypothetical protein [Devosia salina]QYO78388.1 hypothetical protein K1X15_07535 [Devosia salina]
MNISPLAALNRPTSRAGQGQPSWRDPANRSLEQLKILATHRYTNPKLVTAWALTDDEIKQIYVDNNAKVIANWGVEPDGPYSHLYTVQHLGGACLHHGWSILPQDRPGTWGAPDGGEARKPSRIPYSYESKGGSKVFWEQFYPAKWRDRLMTLRQFVQLHELLEANLAIQCCAASGNARAWDIDCRTPEVAEAIKQLAFKHLGATPFVRIGSAPKLMLIYRVEGEEDLALKKETMVLGDADGNPDLDDEGKPLNIVEYLGEGAIITAYGVHHKTGRDFDWSTGTLHPAAAGPEHAPIVTKAMMRDFVNAVQALRPIIKTRAGASSNPFGGKATITDFSEKRDHHGRRLWIPSAGSGDWTVDENGNVVDGAEQWLTDQVWAACGANAHDLDRLGVQNIEEGLISLAKRKLLSVRRENKALSSESAVERAVVTKLKRAVEKWKASIASFERGDGYHKATVPWKVASDGRRPTPQRVRSERPEDGSLDWLPVDTCPVAAFSDIQPRAKTTIVKKKAEEVFRDYAARALIDTQAQRKATGDVVSSGVRGHIGAWLMESVSVYLQQETKEPQAPWVLRAPTGAGKTVSVIVSLADFCHEHPRQPGDGPILLVLPTHANADEAIAMAERNGMIVPGMTEAEVVELIAEGKKAGVKIARFRGREASGCQRSAEMRALSDKGIRSTGLCEARVEDGDARDARESWKEGKKLPYKTIQCPFRERGECEYYRQFNELETADVVIVAHAYLTLNSLPKELKNPRAVIIDESTTYQLLQQTRFPVSTLNAPRQKPYVTKLDRKLNPGASDEQIAESMVQDREELCGIVTKWLLDGLDVAAELMKHDRCYTLLMSAISVCDRSHMLDRKVRPDLTAMQVVTLSEEPVGRHLIAEIRFWKTVRERIEWTRAGTAKGKRDARWQMVMDWETKETEEGKRVEWTPHVRLSWRRGPNWSGIPMLLLDASANGRIIEKTFGYKPEVRDVAAPLHVRCVAMIERTWANSAFVPRPDSAPDEIKAIAQTISEARRLITTTAVLYGHGRVLVGTTIAVREVLTGGGWVPPPNIDFVHYGALRGLDFAKGHVAAISIGRSEQPISIVDGYVAALTFDDDEPEEPYDALGTGITQEGKVLFRKQGWRTIAMRSGQDVEHLVPEMPKREERWPDGQLKATHRMWATELEESWREEEIRQFVGRLRPVYRGVDDDLPPPVWLAVGKILPAGIVVDELVEMQSMIKISPMAELVRLGGGVLADNVTPRIPGSQDILQGSDLETMIKATLPSDKRFLERFAGAFQSVGYELASAPGRRRRALILAGWIDGDPVDAWLALSERHGELPQDLVEKPARLAAPVAKRKPADKRDVNRDDQAALEAEVSRLHREMDAEIPRSEFEIRLGRGDYLPGAATG